MRYIYANPKTGTLLSSWAGPLPQTTAAFFFWNSGTLLQRSQIGLLRSILYEIFDQNKGLIVNLLPTLWARTYTSLVRASIDRIDKIAWPLETLKQVFHELVTQDKIPLKICLFIDGVDEYEGVHRDIVDLIRGISRSANIKVCLSSRPLLPFTSAFKSDPSLCLEELTFEDIRQYATDHLENNERFKSFDAPELIDEIVKKAEGVFLWVKLVVESLLAGLEDLDNISELRKTLEELPLELAGMYTHILSQIKLKYKKKASEYFQLLRAVNLVDDLISSTEEEPEMLTIFGLALADNEDFNLAYAPETQGWSDAKITEKCESMVDRLRVRCLGLLEVQKPHHLTRSKSLRPQDSLLQSKRRVQYLHRTLREYLDEPEFWKLQVQLTSKYDFNPHLQMLKAYILQLKFLPVATPFLLQTMPITLAHAHFGDTGEVQPYVKLLDQLELTVNNIWKRTPYEMGIIDYWKDGPILVKAVQYGCGTYVKQKLSIAKIHKSYLEFNGRPLLDIALRPGLQNTQYPFSPLTIEALLLLGADPNRKYKNATPWELAIKTQLEKHLTIPSDDHENDRKRECARQGVAVFSLFLNHGAKPDICCRINNELMSALTVVDRTCTRLGPEETAELRKQLEGADKVKSKRHLWKNLNLLRRKKDM
jgi:hypothetical protein